MQEAVSILHEGQVLRGMQHIPGGAESAPAVILLHGFTGTKLEPHRQFLKISRALEQQGAASFRFDFLGSGESDGNFEEMTVLRELAEAKTILEYVRSHPAVDPNRVTVLGFSLGGLVASLLGGDVQDDIHKLILVAPAGTFPQKAAMFADEAMYIPEKDAYDLDGNLIGRAFVEEAAGIEVWERASAFRKEVLLIHGTNDEAVPFEVSSLYMKQCYKEQATLHVIAGADHTFNSFLWEQDLIAAVCKFV
ncbi:alpha/beta hydrolase [Ectobacillus ponti]|uniref:Lysophospholipase n=1 Tax=Ectobacillus ponti TaxID=2961894 RepID=A0AA41X512_9BACI|nr:alpha/beta fold hydrolase [Ectobacillus ponti]MCP8968882.1 lysophospholipase [Ectobacillus ponti]